MTNQPPTGLASVLRAVDRNAEWLRASQIPPARRELPIDLVRGDCQEGDLVVLRSCDLEDLSGGSLDRSTARGSYQQKVGNWLSVGGYVARTLVEGRFDASSRAALRATHQRFSPRAGRRTHGRLGPDGGLVYQVVRRTGDVLSLASWDHGGILDGNPNTEMSRWPAQAMGMYYADAYAAVVFANRTGDAWHRAARAALAHARRTYHKYVRAPIWYHHEFKNAPMLEAWEALGQPDGDDWIARLHGDNYDPLNVMAVRLHWLAARMNVAPQAGDRRRLESARSRLLHSQQPSGLFRDDRPPGHVGVWDLSYHLFTLAFLSRYLDHRDDALVESAFLHGLDVVRGVALDDGAVALTGRGTNNVYHQAAAALACAAASERLGNQGSSDGAGDFAHHAQAFLRPVVAGQLESGSWPTCLNDFGDQRMAWNHCATPYNALTSYFIDLAIPRLVREGEGVMQRRPALSHEFARATAEFDIVVAAGYHGSVWSGRHGSGVAGAAGLTIGGRQLLLALDHLDDLGLQVTLLPRVLINGTELDWREPGIATTQSSRITYTPTTAPVSVSLRAQGSTLEVECSVSGADVLVAARLPVLDGIEVHGLPQQAARVVVPSNPRGPGIIYTWPLVGERSVAGSRFRYRVSLHPGLITLVAEA